MGNLKLAINEETWDRIWSSIKQILHIWSFFFWLFILAVTCFVVVFFVDVVAVVVLVVVVVFVFTLYIYILCFSIGNYKGFMGIRYKG
jgi:hypothetical protein